MILLGINSSGLIHFGNYLSLIKPVYKYNLKKIFLADLHCFSKNICFLNVLKNKILTIFTFLSFFKNNYFYQSFNLNILKIFWLILCFYNKNKTKFFHFFNRKKFFSLGKICYPLLMCSDIINNNNKFIFIGIDQIQHIEIYKKIKKCPERSKARFATEKFKIGGQNFFLPESPHL
uniref:Tryptophan--tRNA ligase n=1 Tax=Cacopsylla melanoneura TaxID=428564 RepID=A0A8D8VDW6_9HEMI